MGHRVSGTLRAAVVVSLLGAGLAVPSPAGAAPAEQEVALTSEPAVAEAPGTLVTPFVVVTGANRLRTWRAERAVRQAGGTVVSSYPQVGVVVAYSAKDDFAANVRHVPGIDAVGATRTAKIPVEFFRPRTDVKYTGPGSTAVPPAEGTAWDAPALGLDKAHEVTQGSKRVVVGVLDTGVDDTHPDLSGAFDRRNSISCLSGWADRSVNAWRPTLDGHGTHVSGTIAAARNGAGVVGIAPGVRLAAVKLAETDDHEAPEAVVCGFVWAAEHGFSVASNSYRTLPWYYACDNQIDQAAIKLAVGRAVAYAQRKDVLVVASGGNAGINLDKRTVDTESPVDSTPASRPIDPSCIRLPHELPGVVGTGALDEKLAKASFSNYSATKITVSAPGVRVWSTWPGGQYRTASGTSMAAPHAAGVAALIASTHPWWGAERVKRALLSGATPMPCPALYDPNGDGKPDAVCEPARIGNTFYGAGVVNAITAVGARP
ncbi:Serine protease, subtilisin family [Amycolatopsis xylanica]|uniref:Serine protease, subtilisin family n=1 Tax=Amycolatopsis xylanica TaxID=589385 RepID=A0A1H3SJ06_9PSEU|nr:S8 family serine peptidase [Amycolatopsis xylanica]SDZ37565.1 Serine protease, subtilisin family [Amycolatopsis xylanica]